MHTPIYRSVPLLVLAFGTTVLVGQESGGQPPYSRRGFQVSSVSVYSGYYSSALPGVGFQPGLMDLPSDVGVGGSAQFDWIATGERTNIFLSYSPSYAGRVRFSSWSAFNHSLSFNAERKLARKWSFGFSLAAGLSTLEQVLFSPTVFSSVASVPTSFDGLASAMMAGRFTNPQLASILTGAPLVESPARNLFYGARMFTGALRTSLSYSPSSRWAVTIAADGTRNQHVSQNQRGIASDGYLIPASTSGSASLTASYALSTRTQLGASVLSSRISSIRQDVYTTASTASLGRTIGRRWFLQIRGGVGFMNPIRQTSAVSNKPYPVVGGSLGFKTISNTLLGSYDRAVSDPYGLGGVSTTSVTTTWRWSRPGGNWWLEGNASQQQLQSDAFGNTSSFRAVGSLGRVLAAHLALLTQFSYLSYSLPESLSSAPSLSQSAVRLSVIWSPQPRAFH